MAADFPQERVALPTGVELDVVTSGDPANPPIILLHGFPESHRTWRHQIPVLAQKFFVIAPDQRGYAHSSKPEGVESYATANIIADILALADHYGAKRFTLVGHDWGGAVAWGTAITHPDRVERLIIINAPHPFVFQKTMFDDEDQRRASQYIRAFRNPALDEHIARIGVETFFDTTFVAHADPALMAAEKPYYLEQWSVPGALTAMFNWYRAAAVVVPDINEPLPERPAFLNAPFPPTQMPVLVIWGMRDTALRPSQIEGLDAYVPDLSLVKVDAGHFVPWEAPDVVNGVMMSWLGVAETV